MTYGQLLGIFMLASLLGGGLVYLVKILGAIEVFKIMTFSLGFIAILLVSFSLIAAGNLDFIWFILEGPNPN